MKLKFSKIKKFKTITGQHIFTVQKGVGSDDPDKMTESLETLALGLYLLDTEPNLKEAQNEFSRLKKDDERFDIIDSVDIDELLQDVVGE